MKIIKLFVVTSLLTLISHQTYSQYAEDGERLWLTGFGGYNTQYERFGLKADIQYPSIQWLTWGGELSLAKREYGYWNLNTNEFIEATAWLVGVSLRVDYHPLLHSKTNPKWDPYIGLGGGYYSYVFEESPGGYFDFSFMLGTRYWINQRWGIDLDLGIRERLGFNLGVTYSFKE